MLFFSRSHHFSILSASLSCFCAPSPRGSLLFSSLLYGSILSLTLSLSLGSHGPALLLSFALCWRRRVLGSAGRVRPASEGSRPSIRATRLHVGPSCCWSRLVWLSFNRGRCSRRVVAICVRCICAAAAAHAAVECRAAAWGAGRNRGCATITITHSVQASRTSRAYSAASRGAATATATRRTVAGAVGSARR